jgi:hypothetical protein
VTWRDRAVTTGTTVFSRTVGSAMGVAAFGALVNTSVTRALGVAHPEIENLSPGVLEPAIHTTFVVSVVVAGVLVLIALLMPRVVEPAEFVEPAGS